MQKKAVYVFEHQNEYGINEVPPNRLVLVESTGNLYFLKDNNLSEQNTVQDAIDSGYLVLYWNEENDGLTSGLEAISSTYWNGYRIIGASVNEPQDSDGEDGDIWFMHEEGTPPEDVPESPTNLIASTDREDGVYLTWDNPVSTLERPVEGLRLYRDNNYLRDLPASQDYYLDQSVDLNTEYDYYIVAWNSLGESIPSNIATGKMILRPGSVTFDSPGTYYWEVPNNVTEVNVKMTGGGGAGAYCAEEATCAGGYAGQCIEQTVAVTPGDVITVVVGEGGAGSNNTSIPGGDGGYSSFGDLTVSGGNGAFGDNGFYGSGESKTTCSEIYYNGTSYLDEKGGYKYGGEASAFGNGGNAAHTCVNGNSGGFGAGGGSANRDDCVVYSGRGGHGLVKVSWG